MQKKKIRDFNRQALHAKSLEFLHPKTKKKIFFEAERPKDFDSLIKSLKKASLQISCNCLNLIIHML